MNERVGFWEMQPDNSKLIRGKGWVLYNYGKEYLVVLPNGGSYEVDLDGVTESLPVEKLDPIKGQVLTLPSTDDNPSNYSGSVAGFTVIHIGLKHNAKTPPRPPHKLKNSILTGMFTKVNLNKYRLLAHNTVSNTTYSL